MDDNAWINAVGRAILDSQIPKHEEDIVIPYDELFSTTMLSRPINQLLIHDGMSPPLYYNSQGNIAVHGWGGLP